MHTIIAVRDWPWKRRCFCFIGAIFGAIALINSVGKCCGEDAKALADFVSHVREVGPAFVANRQVTGQDGATSMVLDSQRSLWVFGDTATKPFQSIRTVDLSSLLSSSGMIVPHQAAGAGLQQFEYLVDDAGRVRSLLEYASDEDPAKIRLWPIHGVRHGPHLYLFYHKIELDPRVDVFENFRLLGMGVARAEVGQWRFERIESTSGMRLWWTSEQPTYGVWVQASPDGFLYLWGSLMTGMFLARCRPNDLDHLERYEYLTRCATQREPMATPRWSTAFDPAAVLFDNVPNEMSCHYSRHLKKFVAVHMWNREPRIVMRTSPEITGPWSEPITLYEPPMLEEGTFYYAAKAHPELSDASGQTCYVTYVDSQRYTPRLLEVRWK